jgi:hypothetical protein
MPRSVSENSFVIALPATQFPSFDALNGLKISSLLQTFSCKKEENISGSEIW